ncbi:subtilisin-like protein [Mycena albidolilacea]|uniref:tripeptidyl-peptidase II n=1 Tax=Mycena albidolilacea TaxID=1033008 RepID=A0AAD7ASS7_9AGAR|nr:subtilisin-like protein [Mycena albidolilacea]
MLALFPLALVAVATAHALSPFVQHGKRNALPPGWSRARRHAPDAVLPLRFGLTQPNVDMNILQSLLNDVSHPDSPNYGNHWSPARVAQHFAPSNETIQAVVSWIVKSGVPRDRVRVSKTKGWVQVLNATVAEAETLLKAEYHVFEHESDGQHVACDAYHLPAHVVPHVEIVTPTIDFNPLRKRGATHINLGQPDNSSVRPVIAGKVSTILNELENCDKQITPACLRALYGFVYTPHAPSKNSYGIVEYTPGARLLSPAYRAADLDLFAKNFSTSLTGNLVGKRPVLQSIDGGVLQHIEEIPDYNGESDLDLEYAMNLVTSHQPVTLYQVGDLTVGASFNNFLDALDGSFCKYKGGDDPSLDPPYPDPYRGGYKHHDCGTVEPAYVISTSYSYDEAALSPAYAARQCAEYAKLGMMGVTMLFASGDDGVAGNNGFCLNPDGTRTAKGRIFTPAFPVSCPFVVAVGATQIKPGATVTDPEIACETGIASGGGFSNYFTVPDYQNDVVTGYVKSHLTTPPLYPGLYSIGTRAYPDLSANGCAFSCLLLENEFILVAGTSASTPVVGAMLAMINDARLAIHKKPIGFINPAIYSPLFQGAFNDVTSGNNPGCGKQGFPAAKGWDPVTGLGTPNFPKLLALWLAAK